MFETNHKEQIQKLNYCLRSSDQNFVNPFLDEIYSFSCKTILVISNFEILVLPQWIFCLTISNYFRKPCAVDQKLDNVGVLLESIKDEIVRWLLVLVIAWLQLLLDTRLIDSFTAVFTRMFRPSAIVFCLYDVTRSRGR